MVVLKKKLCLGIVGLCGLALIVDRLVPASQITGPESILAAQNDLSTAVDAAPAASIPQLPFPRTIPAWDPTQTIRDLFAPPMAGRTQSMATPGGDAGSENTRSGLSRGGMSRSAFASTHTLNAVMVVGRMRVAVLGEEWVREGQVFDGCTLNRIAGNQAVFSCYDGNVTLTSGLDNLPSHQR